MNNPKFNTTFIFAVLSHTTGSISFFPRSTTFGEIAKCYQDSRVTYMPHFQLEKTDVLYYQDEPFTSFEALFNTYGEEALHDTFIYKDQPKYDITNKAILVDSGDDIEEVQLTLFELGCVWSGDTQGELLDELYGTAVELVFFVDANKEMTWSTNYLAHMEEELEGVETLTFYKLTQAIKPTQPVNMDIDVDHNYDLLDDGSDQDTSDIQRSQYFVHDLDNDTVTEYLLFGNDVINFNGEIFFCFSSLVHYHGEEALSSFFIEANPLSYATAEFDGDIPF